jgi:hypothetical protein
MNLGSAHRLLILFSTFALLSFVSGCGDEDDDIVAVRDTEIRVSVVTTSNELDSGQTIGVKAVVSGAGKMGELTYSWRADAGSFGDAAGDSTGWTAPDAPGVYPLAVIVTDGEKVGIGTADVAVATYLPAATPFYRGSQACAVCHTNGPGGDQFAGWQETRHAHAIESLRAIGQDDNPVCQGCHTVGSYGLFADEDLDNGGYDETMVARLEGVQCENCHGPGSEHPSPRMASVADSLAVEVCAGCHNGSHHPTYDEWLSSAHGSGTIASAATRASCAKCHNGTEGPRYLDNPSTYVAPSANPTEVVAHTCPTCHDPHSAENPGQLRNASVMPAVLPNAVVVEAAGAGRLCINCHNGRRTDTDVAGQITNGAAHMGPHHSVQGDMLAGVNAYEQVNPSFTFASSKHLLVEDGCVHCHTHRHAADPLSGNEQFTGHTFEPTVEACQECHGPLQDFIDIIAKQDFDGNGLVQGVQIEVAGLMELLKETIIVNSNSPENEQLLRDAFDDNVGLATVTTIAQREAAYNLLFVEFDGSSGVHNTTYAVQLLQQSILRLDPNALPSAAYIVQRYEEN